MIRSQVVVSGKGNFFHYGAWDWELCNNLKSLSLKISLLIGWPNISLELLFGSIFKPWSWGILHHIANFLFSKGEERWRHDFSASSKEQDAEYIQQFHFCQVWCPCRLTKKCYQALTLWLTAVNMADAPRARVDVLIAQLCTSPCQIRANPGAWHRRHQVLATEW